MKNLQRETRNSPLYWTRHGVTIADASNLPIYHVNALGLRASNDEFFFTLGVVTPPDQAEVAAATEAGWRKFIRMSTQRPGAESVLTVIPAERTTTAGPIFFKPALSPEDYEARIESFLHFLDSLGSETETVDDVAAEQEEL